VEVLSPAPRPAAVHLPELALGAAGIVWRLATIAPAAAWRDWPLVLSVLLLGRGLAPRWRGWPAALPAAAAYLLGIYVHGQWPLLLGVLLGAP
jgi:hypothetical protein